MVRSQQTSAVAAVVLQALVVRRVSVLPQRVCPVCTRAMTAYIRLNGAECRDESRRRRDEPPRYKERQAVVGQKEEPAPPANGEAAGLALFYGAPALSGASAPRNADNQNAARRGNEPQDPALATQPPHASVVGMQPRGSRRAL